MQKKNSQAMPASQLRKTLRDNLSFTAAEAYKLLRTNLLFTLPGESESRCRVIGVTSSIRGEGKSTTAINLSYSLAEMGKRVLLIDGDMRLPSVANKMEIPNAPGLSNVLVASGSDVEITLRPSGSFTNWKIITAGDLPPNPSELLSSKRMHAVIDALASKFDFIIVDLPPVNAVSDALVISPLLDGIIVVVRENYNDRKELRSCIRQLSMAKVKVFGIVMNGAKENRKRYGKRGHYGYKKYYKSKEEQPD